MNPANYVVGEGALARFTDPGVAARNEEAVGAAAICRECERRSRTKADAIGSHAVSVEPSGGRLWVSSIPGRIMEHRAVPVEKGSRGRRTH